VHIAPSEIAIDLILIYAVCEELLSFLCELKTPAGIVLANLCFNLGLARRKSSAYLTAIPARRPKSYRICFEYDDFVTRLSQGQGG
jgi:hypothetical protein